MFYQIASRTCVCRNKLYTKIYSLLKDKSQFSRYTFNFSDDIPLRELKANIKLLKGKKRNNKH